MTPPPQPFRLVYRSFDAVEFDPIKNDEVFELRGFDLAYARQIFPGYVLEREDTRGYDETRFQVIGEVMEDVAIRGLYPPGRRHLPIDHRLGSRGLGTRPVV